MSPSTELTVRSLETQEDRRAGELFARAFLHDPFTLAVGPDHAGLRGRLLTLQFGMEVAAVRASGGTVVGVHRDGELVAALTADEGPVRVARLPSRAQLPLCTAGPAVLRRSIRSERALGLARPSVPHIYVLKVAVAARHRGTGLGRLLMDAVMQDADARGLPVHLDTMTEENVAFYERLGFGVTGRLALPRGLSAWLMARPA